MDLPRLFLQVGKRDFSRGIADIASKFGIMSSSESDPPGFEVSLCLFLSVEATLSMPTNLECMALKVKDQDSSRDL